MGNLDQSQLEEASRLLAKGFVQYEPLSRTFGLKEDDLMDFFRLQLKFSAERGYAAVVTNEHNRVVAAMTVEDHLDPLTIGEDSIDPRVKLILDYLNELKLPPELTPSRLGQVFYSGIAAVDPEYQSRRLLNFVVTTTCLNMGEKGFRYGYAKVSNSGIKKSFTRLEKILPGVFIRRGKVLPASEFSPIARFAPTHFELATFFWSTGVHGFRLPR